MLLFNHVIHNVHDLLAKGISFFHGMCFRINTNDGFGVALAEVYPLVSEVNLHAINVCNLLVFVEFLNLLQNSKDISCWVMSMRSNAFPFSLLSITDLHLFMQAICLSVIVFIS